MLATADRGVSSRLPQTNANEVADCRLLRFTSRAAIVVTICVRSFDPNAVGGSEMGDASLEAQSSRPAISIGFHLGRLRRKVEMGGQKNTPPWARSQAIGDSRSVPLIPRQDSRQNPPVHPPL